MEILLGTYTRNTDSEGIYRASFDAQTGKLDDLSLALKADNPSFLAIDSMSLFAVSEIRDGVAGGDVLAYDRSDGKFDLIDVVPSFGSDPCHLAIGPHHLAVANYSGGTATLYQRAGSRLKPDPHILKHSKCGNHPRQADPHPHGAYFITDELWVPDLGGDRIEIYNLEGTHLRSLTTTDGSGPRHLTGNGRYLVNELDNTVVDLETGVSCASIPHGWYGQSITAEIVLANDRLYVSNRGHDSIAVLSTSPTLELIQCCHSGGSHPRHFAITPDHKWLIAANKDSHNLVSMPILDDGRLGDVTSILQCPSPTCVLVLSSSVM